VWLGVRSVAGISQRGYKIFLALPLEFFLRGFEVCNARRDLFALASEAIFLFGHAYPLIPAFDFLPLFFVRVYWRLRLGREWGRGVAGL
jgi:hypothetical protein